LRILCLSLFIAAISSGQQGLPDPAFNKIPFEEWLKGGGETRIRWSVRVTPVHLTVHERLMTAISVRVEGAEFVKRTKPGQLVFFMEIRDRDNHTYQMHRELRLGEVKQPSVLASVAFEQSTFITSGIYDIAAAVYDVESKEHSLKRIKLRVPELTHDPLPSAWLDLPKVEFADDPDPPDRWYLPQVSSRLRLPVQTEEPVRVEVVLNESATAAMQGRSGRVSRRNMGTLIPALKVLSQIKLLNGSMNVTLLDLERRKVDFRQEAIDQLDWTRLRAALTENDPGLINVHELANREQNAQFFVSEIRKRLDAAQVLIVLTSPMAFGKGEDLRPIDTIHEPGKRIFYIRYNPARPTVRTGGPVEFGRGNSSGNSTSPILRPPPVLEDSLEGTLKPLAPRLFNVATPTDFRSALATIMREISLLK
jgi:hypothetical protein